MFDNPIVILSVLALLPLIPAILLFKLLPGGNTEVEGPLAGLKVKLGGAFGGYVALTVFLATFYATSLKPTATSVEWWTVTGEVKAPEYADITCKLSPPLNIDPGNRFEWRIPVAKGAELPSVYLDAPGYEGETLYLSKKTHINKKYPVDIDEIGHVVNVRNAISLRKKNFVATTPSSSPGPMTSGGL